VKEAFPPFADDLAGQVKTLGDPLVVQPLGGEKDDLGADDLAIRRRISACRTLKVSLLTRRKNDFVWAPSWHIVPPFGKHDT